jgi:TolB-like protein
VYKVLIDPKDVGKLIGEKPKPSAKKWILPAVVIAAIVLSLIIWQFYQTESEPTEKPSIAVLPFENMSNDPEQEYFSDGLTDELIADLAKIKDILVISRNSAFTYKGKTVKVQRIAQELNVRYILEGSVQRSGNKVRIRAQLIDGKTDHHLWSESYDGVMDDIFELQDKITEKIVSALSVTLTSDEQDRITDKGTDSIPAYDTYLKGFEHYSRMTGDNLLKAIKYYREAVKIDPNFSRAYSGLAAAYYMSTSFNFPWESQIKIMWDIMTFKIKARHYLNLAMKNPTWEAYVVATYMDIARKRFDEAVSSAEKALLMAPNEYLANIAMGHVLNCLGRAGKALKYLDTAMRLDPRFLDILLVEKGKAFFILGDYEKAVASIQRGLTLNPALTNYSSFEAASHAFLGKTKEAENAWHRFVDGFQVREYLTTKYLYDFFPFKDHKVFDRFIDGLNKAGFEGNPSDYYKVDKKNRLSGQKIKELLFGKIATGYNLALKGFSYRWTAEGDFEFSCPRAAILEKGKSRIEGDSICHQYEYLYDGIKVCMDVYYITEGNDDAKNQYLYIGDSGFTAISIKE